MRKKIAAQVTPKTIEAIENAIGGLQKWAHKCHECSLAMVRTGLLPATARVARGFHPQITSQHSWVVIGDPYDTGSLILDGVLWSYLGTKPVTFCGRSTKHYPKGKGNIWQAGKPPHPVGKIVQLKHHDRLSEYARDFLMRAGPEGLDAAGWHVLANSPVQGWPAKEIITAMYRTDNLAAFIPIDVVGMVTDLNPGNLYW